MGFLRTIAVLTVAFFLTTGVALARDLTGIYLETDRHNVVYLNLTDSGGLLSGYVQIVTADLNASGGVQRNNTPFSGSDSNSRIVFNLSSGARWTASASWTGITIDIPQNTGQILQVQFRRSSVAEINHLIESLSQNAGQAKSQNDAAVAHAQYVSNTSANLTDSQNRLNYNLHIVRPKVLAAIVRAKNGLTKAVEEKQDAEAEVSRLQDIANQKHTTADDAKDAATSDDERNAARQLGYDANQADYDVTAAKYKVNSAQYVINSAIRDVDDAQADLHRVDARNAQLRGYIAQDHQVLAHP